MASDPQERKGFWLLIGLVMLVSAGAAVLGENLDPDCFWHMRVAEQLQHDGIGPLVDRISFATPKHPWAPYSWLAELGMKWLWDLGGLRAAVLSQAILQAVFVWLLALCCLEGARREKRRSLLGVLLVVIFSTILAIRYLSFRPVLPVAVLLEVQALLLLRDRRLDQRSRAVWLIVPLTAVTMNMHFFALFSCAWVGALLVGAIIESPRVDRSVKRYALMLLLCISACCATPMLPGTIATLREYAVENPLVKAGLIAEMHPMYADWDKQICLGLILLAIGSAMWRHVGRARLRPSRFAEPAQVEQSGSDGASASQVTFAQDAFGSDGASPSQPDQTGSDGASPSRSAVAGVRLGEWLWLFGMLVVTAQCGRAAPVFVPIFAACVAGAMPKLSDRVLGTALVRYAAILVLIVGAVRIGLAMPDNQRVDAWLNRRGPDMPGYPAEACDFVAAHVPRVSGKLINEFNWGGYLAWKMPAYQVLVDGRAQLYTPGFWRATYLGDRSDATEFLSRVDADAAILPTGNSRFHASLVDLGWRCVYRDERSEVLVPSGAIARVN